FFSIWPSSPRPLLLARHSPDHPPAIMNDLQALLVARCRLLGELVEGVRHAYVALHGGVQQALRVRAELRVPDRRAAREERADVWQFGRDDVAALKLAAVGQLLQRGGAAGQAALRVVDRDRVLGLLPPLDEGGGGGLVLGRDRDREALGQAERAARAVYARHQRDLRVAGDAGLAGVVGGGHVARAGG